MSNHIPFEIQSEIIKRVHPVKSLVRFRSVCKEWKSSIDSPEFITHHLLNNNTQHHLLISYSLDFDMKYVAIVDDNENENDIDTFPQHKSYPTLPPTGTNNSMLDSSHGLVCFLSLSRELPSNLIVVWNPFIRKSVVIVLPVGTYIAGFGVCPNTSDIKIVAIKTPSTAEVFTLSTRIWRRIPMNLSKSVIFMHGQVVVDGVVHWLAFDSGNRMIAFDLASEEVGEVALPDGLVRSNNLEMSRFKESLAVINYHYDDVRKIVCDVWVMLKNGVTKSSFTKLFTIQHNSFGLSVIGFRMNGQPIVKLKDGSKKNELQVYEPDSEHVNGLGIYGLYFDMVNYTESLLLLNHSDSIIQ